MTYHQWAAVHGQALTTDARLAFEAVWHQLIGGGCSPSQASSLLTDIIETLPEPQFEEEDDCE